MSNKNKRSQKDIQTCMQMNKKKKKNESSLLSSLPSSQLWSLLPEDVIIYNILLKLPVNTLLRLRCVCRYFHSLITNPSFVQNHLYQYSNAQPNLSLLGLSTTEVYHLYNEIAFRNFVTSTGGGNDIIDIDPNVVVMRSPFESAIRGSCNGLLFLGGKDNKDPVYIWNPCTKEYKELPLPSTTENKHLREHLFGIVETTSNNFELSMFMSMLSSGFCGFGYDRTNDEYKIMYYESWVGHGDGHPVSLTEFKLYRLRTDTWTNFSIKKSYRSIFLEYPRESTGLFVNGALYWIMISNHYTVWWQAKIVSFDMEKEEFREIQQPPLEEKEPYVNFQLKVLDGYLCLCQFPKSKIIKRVDIWMLKDYAIKDSWTKLYTIVFPVSLAIYSLRVLRFCQNGEIIMRIMMLRDHRKHLLVYNSVNQKARHDENLDETFICSWENEVMYTESLVSLNSSTYAI